MDFKQESVNVDSSENKGMRTIPNTLALQSHTVHLWAVGVWAWEKELLSLSGDYDSRSCPHSAQSAERKLLC